MRSALLIRRQALAGDQAFRRSFIQSDGVRAPGLQSKRPSCHGAARIGRTRLLGDEPAQAIRDCTSSWRKFAADILWLEGSLAERRFLRGVVYEALGIPTDLFTPIFAISRVAGWLAHWNEQLEGNRIFRPEQVYSGKADVEYIPPESRP